jgi:5-methylcytosine-specific restriction endonuclease McrA
VSTARRPVDPRPRRERLEAVLARDGARCVWCRRPFDAELVRPTVEHVVPRLKGGPAWIENELAACSRCNRLRGHRGPLEWLDDCERRGWRPDAEAVARSLRALDAAIAQRGGQRRARPYLAAQLRRLDRREAQAARAVPWDTAR